MDCASGPPAPRCYGSSRPLGVVGDVSSERARTRARTALLVERDSMTGRVSFEFHHTALAAAAAAAATAVAATTAI